MFGRRWEPPPGLRRVERARDLPTAWDDMAGTFFRSRAFLQHCERYNPCGQRYWLWEPDGRLTASTIAYDLTLDLLTYRGMKSPLRMTVLGVPCSVAWPGLMGDRTAWPTMLPRILERERGLVLGLNTTAPITMPSLVQGDTLPTLVLEHRFESWEVYTAALRSDYRRRHGRIAAEFEGVDIEVGPCDRLGEDAYRLYVGAFERSDAKLEKLSWDFLRELPPPLRLTRFHNHGRLLGWHVTAVEPERTTFFMGGVDQALNEGFRTYFNLLFHVVRMGIEAGTPIIDLGQTAEVPKLRSGGRTRQRMMFAWHRRGLARKLLRHAAPWLVYDASFDRPRVFKVPQ